MLFRGLCFSVLIPADIHYRAEEVGRAGWEFQLLLGNQTQLFPSSLTSGVMQAIFCDMHSFKVCFLCGAENKTVWDDSGGCWQAEGTNCFEIKWQQSPGAYHNQMPGKEQEFIHSLRSSENHVQSPFFPKASFSSLQSVRRQSREEIRMGLIPDVLNLPFQYCPLCEAAPEGTLRVHTEAEVLQPV